MGTKRQSSLAKKPMYDDKSKISRERKKENKKNRRGKTSYYCCSFQVYCSAYWCVCYSDSNADRTKKEMGAKPTGSRNLQNAAKRTSKSCWKRIGNWSIGNYLFNDGTGQLIAKKATEKEQQEWVFGQTAFEKRPGKRGLVAASASTDLTKPCLTIISVSRICYWLFNWYCAFPANSVTCCKHILQI